MAFKPVRVVYTLCPIDDPAVMDMAVGAGDGLFAVVGPFEGEARDKLRLALELIVNDWNRVRDKQDRGEPIDLTR